MTNANVSERAQICGSDPRVVDLLDFLLSGSLKCARTEAVFINVQPLRLQAVDVGQLAQGLVQGPLDESPRDSEGPFVTVSVVFRPSTTTAADRGVCEERVEHPSTALPWLITRKVCFKRSRSSQKNRRLDRRTSVWTAKEHCPSAGMPPSADHPAQRAVGIDS